MPDKLFTLEEALALLPAVRQMLLEIQQRKRDVEERSARLDGLLGMAGGNGHHAADIEALRAELHSKATQLQQLMGELDQTGAVLKGIDDGLLDFPSLREGRVVYLCWRLGEDTISYWHEMDTGFAGRQPL
ncbi:MAG TPA: DUF2203 domain-containing protein [Dehalococcoidia bacterium]|nr:DUF2203 domain-containing protein [Dehalococcoidia bacterium]